MKTDKNPAEIREEYLKNMNILDLCKRGVEFEEKFKTCTSSLMDDPHIRLQKLWNVAYLYGFNDGVERVKKCKSNEEIELLKKEIENEMKFLLNTI